MSIRMSRKDRLQIRSSSDERKVRGTQSRVPGGSGAVETKVLRQVEKIDIEVLIAIGGALLIAALVLMCCFLCVYCKLAKVLR